jgi:predicted ATPase
VRPPPETKADGVVSSHRGVCWIPRATGWRAQISVDGATKYLGTFDDEDAAAAAYQAAAWAKQQGQPVPEAPPRRRKKVVANVARATGVDEVAVLVTEVVGEAAAAGPATEAVGETDVAGLAGGTETVSGKAAPKRLAAAVQPAAGDSSAGADAAAGDAAGDKVAKRGKRAQRGHTFTLLLTGAPCAGKTTTLLRLRDLLERNGACMVGTSEVATDLLLGQPQLHGVDFQREVLRRQLAAEVTSAEECVTRSEAGRDVLWVLDRGTRDGKLFCDGATWAAIGGDEATATIRYDLVLHLVSTAVDLPDVFDDAQRWQQNKARHHTRCQSAALCPRFAGLYADAPAAATIDNTRRGMDDKLRRVLELVARHAPPAMASLQAAIPRGLRELQPGAHQWVARDKSSVLKSQ